MSNDDPRTSAPSSADDVSKRLPHSGGVLMIATIDQTVQADSRAKPHDRTNPANAICDNTIGGSTTQ